MKLLTYFLNLVGFDHSHDLLGTFAPHFNKFLAVSLYVGGFAGFIETYTGISFMLWLTICLAAIFDILLGIYANVFYLGNPLDTRRLFRGIFKLFVVMVIIFLTNGFNEGVARSEISPEFLSAAVNLIVSTLHYSSVILIGLYVLLGIAENGAKIEIPFCKTLVKILKLRINKIQGLNND